MWRASVSCWRVCPTAARRDHQPLLLFRRAGHQHGGRPHPPPAMTMWSCGGHRSMSMVPMMGNKIALNNRVCAFQERKHRHRIRHGHLPRTVLSNGRSRAKKDAFAVSSTRRPVRHIAAGKFKDESCATRVDTRCPTLRPAAKHKKARQRRACARRPAWKRWEIEDRVRSRVGTGQRVADVRWCRCRYPHERKGAEGTTSRPLARTVLRRGGCAARNHGHRSDQSHPEGAEAGGNPQDDPNGWMNEAFAAQALWRRATWDSTCPGEPTSGTLLWAIGARHDPRSHPCARHAPRKKVGMVTMCIGTGMGAAGF